eukprot:6274703-Heterocapsa_arctica.AAC.1
MEFLPTHKGKEKSKTGEDAETEDERELLERHISKKEAMEQFRMLEKMIQKLIGMQKKEEREKRHYQEEPEAPEQGIEGAMKTDMTIEEEHIVLDWIEAIPERKEDAKFEDVSHLDIKDEITASMESVQKRKFNAM